MRQRRLAQIASSFIANAVLCILLPHLGTSSRIANSSYKIISKASAKFELSDASSLKRIPQRVQLSRVGEAARSAGVQYNVVLDGFANIVLNGAYIARLDAEHQIQGHETYWSLSGHYFLYKCRGRQWHISFKDAFDAAREGDCDGVIAYHPHFGDIISDPRYGEGWEEELEENNFTTTRGGVIAVKAACSSFQSDPGGCTAIGCEWDGKLCTAPWNLWDASKGPQLKDIAQGDLASCYFLAALSAILNYHPRILQDMFVNPAAKETYHAEGFANPVYVTRWLLMGHVVEVDVDAVVPVGLSGRPSFTSCSGGRFYWASLLEKAWAKIFSNYKAVHLTGDGSVSEAFSAIIQAPIKNIKHGRQHHAHYSGSRSKYRSHSGGTAEKKLWTRLKFGTSHRYPMIGGSHTQTSHVQAKHAFAILSAQEITIGGKLVKTVLLYDSYRTMGIPYKGELVDSNVGLEVGSFRMTFHEYMHDFDVTSIAEVYPGYTITFTDVPKQGEVASSEFTFTMKGVKPFAVQLAWPRYRFLKNAGCPRLQPEALVKVFRGSTLVGQMTRNPLNSNEVRLWLPGGAGHYRVVASARFQNAEWLHKIYLNTYAPESEHVEFRPRTVTMAGFKDQQWNQEYTSSLDSAHFVGGKETFWTSSGERLLYWCKTESLWMATFKDKLPNLMAGACPGWLWGRKNKFITDMLGWHEWYDSRWQTLPSAGALTAARRSNSSSEAVDSGCLRLVNRLDMLHNWQEIKDSNGNDPYFPPNAKSIYDEDDACSFNVTRKEMTACAGYTRWKSLAEISADEVP